MKIVNLQPVTNREDFEIFIWLKDAENKQPIVPSISDNFVFEIKDEAKCVRLTASSDNGKITIVDEMVRVAFPRSEMTALQSGSYSFGFTFSRDGETCQPFIGSIPIHDGIVNI